MLYGRHPAPARFPKSEIRGHAETDNGNGGVSLLLDLSTKIEQPMNETSGQGVCCHQKAGSGKAGSHWDSAALNVKGKRRRGGGMENRKDLAWTVQCTRCHALS